MNKLAEIIKVIRNTHAFSWIVLSFAAITYSLGIQAFIQVSQTFPAGLSAIVTLLTYSLKSLGPYFSVLYLLFNIPLIVFFLYKGIKKTFIYKTIYFLLFQAAFGAIFLVPSIKDYFFTLIVPNSNEIRNLRWPIIILPSLGAILMGLALGLSWKYGGSTGGTDFIAYYWSTKKKRPIGTILLITSLLMVLISFTITISLDEQVRKEWLITVIGTLLQIFISSFVVNIIYPKYAKVYVEIHSQKIPEIQELFKNKKYTHAYRIETFISGYNGKPQKRIVSAMFLLEAKPLVSELKEIDPNIWVSVTKIHSIFGKFVTTAVD